MRAANSSVHRKVRSKCRFKMEDRISTLPSNIIESILMRLPLVDAARSSILSSKWRYEWSTMPHLIFDEHSIPLSVQHKLEQIVDQVLLLHSGPIHKFVFGGYAYYGNFTSVDRWILFLSRNGLKELVLNFSAGSRYKLPSSLYSCESIAYLELHLCELKLSRTFKGFSNLTTLRLENTLFSDDDFTILISKSPHLREVALVDLSGHHYLRFNSTSLQDLLIEGFFEDLYLEHTPNLINLSVGLEDEGDLDSEVDFDNEESEDKEKYNLMKSLCILQRIEKLELGHNVMEYLARENKFETLPTYKYLKKLHLSNVNFQDMRHLLIVRSLFRSSPALEDLGIEADSFETTATVPATSLLGEKECLDFSFERLRTVKLCELLGVEPEMEFIELLLANSPKLEILNVELDKDVYDETKFYKHVMRFRRASTRAEIVSLD